MDILIGSMAEDEACEVVDKSDTAKYQVYLAEQRTTMAGQRNILAVERTFSAWIRTGMSLNAVGLALPKLIGIGSLMMAVRLIGIVLALTAAGMYLMAYRRYRIASKKLQKICLEVAPGWTMLAMVIALVFCALLSLLIIVVAT